MEHRFATIAVRLLGLFLVCSGLPPIANCVYILLHWEPAGWWRMYAYADGPVYLVAGAGLLVASPAIGRWLVGGRLRHHCPACGYDLRGGPHERCPECGGPVRRG